MGVNIADDPDHIGCKDNNPVERPGDTARCMDVGPAFSRWRGLWSLADQGDAGFEPIMLRVLGAVARFLRPGGGSGSTAVSRLPAVLAVARGRNTTRSRRLRAKFIGDSFLSVILAHKRSRERKKTTCTRLPRRTA